MLHPGTLAAEDPPLQPDSTEAREWLERELAKPEYRDEQGLLARLLEWLAQRFDSAPTGAVPTPLLVLLLLLVLIGIAVVVVRGLRTDPGETTPAVDGVFAADDERTASEHRRAARTALADGDHRLAVLEAFRGLARDGTERTLVAASPGLTVHEVVLALTAAFPAKGAHLASVGRHFDRARYGDGNADAEAAHEAVALGEELTQQRPRLPGAHQLSPAGGSR